MVADDLFVRRGLVIPAAELVEQASRSGGPGGQHVNKANTRVTLRWSVRESAALSASQRRRLEQRLAGSLTRGGELLVHAARHRSRARNRALARERLVERVREALRTRRPRVASRPSRAARARTAERKRRRSALKRTRRPVRRDEDR